MEIGMEPITTPNVNPMNIANMLGSRRRLISSPNIFPTLFTELASPTMVSLSPICKCKSGDASKSMPARVTRVMLIPYKLRSRKDPNLTPLIRLRVTMMRLEINWLSIAFQSMSALFQSMFSCSPNSNLMFSTSDLTDITNK